MSAHLKGAGHFANILNREVSDLGHLEDIRHQLSVISFYPPKYLNISVHTFGITTKKHLKIKNSLNKKSFAIFKLKHIQDFLQIEHRETC